MISHLDDSLSESELDSNLDSARVIKRLKRLDKQVPKNGKGNGIADDKATGVAVHRDCKLFLGPDLTVVL